MASYRTCIIVADVLKMVERVDTIEGKHTVICKQGGYEEILQSLRDLNNPWQPEVSTEPVIIGGVLFKPSEQK
jgi:hypothetical protein